MHHTNIECLSYVGVYIFFLVFTYFNKPAIKLCKLSLLHVYFLLVGTFYSKLQTQLPLYLIKCVF
jgi:hypothetical protein